MGLVRQPYYLTKIISMKTKAVFFPMMISLVLLLTSSQIMSQQVSGSRNEASETRQISGFDAVKVGGAFDIYLTQGPDYHVEVIADDNLLEYIETEVEGGVLAIRMRPRTSLRRYKTLEVHITAPEFNSVQVSGACDLFSTNMLQTAEMSISASGASDVKLSLEADFLEVKCSGASDAILSGRAQTIEAQFSGSSDLQGRDLKCSSLNLRMSGSSDARINVEDQVSGSISGSSDLKVIGRPRMDVRTSGASSVSTGG